MSSEIPSLSSLQNFPIDSSNFEEELKKLPPDRLESLISSIGAEWLKAHPKESKSLVERVIAVIQSNDRNVSRSYKRTLIHLLHDRLPALREAVPDLKPDKHYTLGSDRFGCSSYLIGINSGQLRANDIYMKNMALKIRKDPTQRGHHWCFQGVSNFSLDIPEDAPLQTYRDILVANRGREGTIPLLVEEKLLKKLERENLHTLLLLAEEFQLEDLKSAVIEYLGNYFPEDQSKELKSALAHLSGKEPLIEVAGHFILKKLPGILDQLEGVFKFHLLSKKYVKEREPKGKEEERALGIFSFFANSLPHFRNLKGEGLSSLNPGIQNWILEELNPQLNTLNFSGFTGKRLPKELEKFKSLEQLICSNCANLSDVQVLVGLENLKELDLSGCISLKNLQTLIERLNLKKLDLTGCSSLQKENLEVMVSAITKRSAMNIIPPNHLNDDVQRKIKNLS